MAEADGIKPTEQISFINISEEELLNLAKAKERSEQAIQEAKKIAEEIKKEFDRNIKQVQEVASKIFTEAKGKLQQRFEEIERETNKFVAGTKVEIIRTVDKTSTESNTIIIPKLEIKKIATENKKELDKSPGKFKGKITKAIDKFKKVSNNQTNKKEPKKSPQEIKAETDKTVAETKGRINKILDRVKKLKQQVEENREQVNKSIERIEQKINKTITEPNEQFVVNEPIPINKDPIDFLHNIEDFFELNEQEIIKDIGDAILESATKRIFENTEKSINKKPGHLTKPTINNTNKETVAIPTTSTKKEETSNKQVHNKLIQNYTNIKKQVVKIGEKVEQTQKLISNAQAKPETKQSTIQEREKCIDAPKDSSLDAKRDLEKTFEELKEQTAKFSEIADVDLKKAIENIKSITGRIPRRVKPLPKKEAETVRNELNKLKINTNKPPVALKNQTEEDSNKTIKRELFKHLKDKEILDKVINKSFTDPKKTATVFVKQPVKKGAKEQINKLAAASKSQVSKQSDKSSEDCKKPSRVINKPQLQVRKELKIT